MMRKTKRLRFWVTVLAVAIVSAAVVALGLWLNAEQPRLFEKALVEGWRILYRLAPVTDKARLSAMHADAANESREQCIACHGDKLDSRLVIHRIHLQSEVLANLSCHDCHPKVSLGKRTNRTEVRWVDVGVCKQCHSEFPAVAPGKHTLADANGDCAGCHTGKLAVKHEKRYLPREVPASECKGCHGARELQWTARHEGSDWLAVHGDEALATGTDGCFQCHDFGLTFCADCHNEKPPSHLPPERWRTVHSSEAKRDTRVCYSCHKTSYCKKCHLNHEAGWMDRHPDFVRERGDESCLECHSESACSFCHTAATERSKTAASIPATQ